MRMSHLYACVYVHERCVAKSCYGVATMSRLLYIIGHLAEYRLFYRALLLK